ncbi:ankyrin repeat domain-containing protein 13D isoform 2-T2 [Chlamydotis macqueenii]
MARPADTFPLHRLVWHNRHQALDSALRTGTHDVELPDPRGRTPLELAVSLGHLESARVLLRHNANVGRENANGWTVLQEAVSTGDPEMVQLVLQYRDYQRATRRLAGIPELLSKLRRASDFYVEMKWEFTSWVPLVSKVCPSDVYRVWKRGESLRVDTTLLGFEHMTWQRGRRSYIFKGEGGLHGDAGAGLARARPAAGGHAAHGGARGRAADVPHRLHAPGHQEHRFREEQVGDLGLALGEDGGGERLRGQGVQRQQRGAGHQNQDRAPLRPGQVTQQRLQDPLPLLPGHRPAARHPQRGARAAGGQPHQPHGHHPRGIFRPPLRPGDPQHRPSRRGVQQGAEVQGDAVAVRAAPAVAGGAGDAHHRPHGHLQRPLRQTARLHHPQAAPRLPRQDRNLCGCDQPLGSVRVCAPTHPPGTQPPGPGGWPFPCEVEAGVFEVPAGYTVLGAGRSEPLRDEDDDLLQFAIQQSLLDAGTETDQVTIWEALTNTRPGVDPPPYDEDLQLERALQESILLQAGPSAHPAVAGTPPPGAGGGDGDPPAPGAYGSFAEQLRLAMALSEREQEERERRRREEDEELQRILRLSLTEK